MPLAARYTTHPLAEVAPERSIDTPKRLQWARAVLDAHGFEHAPQTALAELSDLERAHDPVYLHGLRALSEAKTAAHLDPELVVDEYSWGQAQGAAGALVAETTRALTQPGGSLRFCLSRPGSHHASRDFAMGFCLVNNLAVAACHALDAGCERVAILDFDAHHGNGTQEIFWREGQVLCVSMHQYPFFPGTGAADEIGAGPGRGATLNLPLAAGRDGRVALGVWERALEQIERFAPQLVLFEAGLDAHVADWTTDLHLDGEAFASLGRMTAQALCAIGAPAVFELGGGYVPETMSDGLDALVSGLKAGWT